MNRTDAIQIRHSDRTYNGLRIDHPSIEAIRNSIASERPLLKDVDKPLIKIIDNDNSGGQLGTYGFIKGARQFLVMAASDSSAAHVQAGYMLEQTILDVTCNGLHTCWLGGTFSRGPFSDAMGDCGGRKVIIVVPIGHIAPKRRFSERMMRRIVKADHRKPFETLFSFEPGLASCPAADIVARKALEAVRLAPSSSNSQPWRAKVSFANNKADSKIDSKSANKHDAVEVVVDFSCKSSGQFAPVDMGIAYSHFTTVLDSSAVPWRVENTENPMALRFFLTIRG